MNLVWINLMLTLYKPGVGLVWTWYGLCMKLVWIWCKPGVDLTLAWYLVNLVWTHYGICLPRMDFDLMVWNRTKTSFVSMVQKNVVGFGWYKV